MPDFHTWTLVAIRGGDLLQLPDRSANAGKRKSEFFELTMAIIWA